MLWSGLAVAVTIAGGTALAYQGRRLPITPWAGLGAGPQHSGVGRTPAGTLGHILWSTPVDLNPQYSGNDLLIHYGSPMITKRNVVVVPVKTGPAGGFRIEGHRASDGLLLWSHDSDYVLPAHGWTPSFGCCLSNTDGIAMPAAGGTFDYRTDANRASATVVKYAFYGLTNYQNDQSNLDQKVRICTPITADTRGNFYFGFRVLGSNSLNLRSGIAKVSLYGASGWIGADTAASDPLGSQVIMNCAPAMSPDGRVLYVGIQKGNGGGYLVGLDTGNLHPLYRARLLDPNTGNNANLSDDGSASPTVGPDGNVYFGVLENPYYSNHLRGWLLHWDRTLTMQKPTGAFGWDDTPSIVPARAVSRYSGRSTYLLMTKYNNYVAGGGTGVNKMAILDPNASMVDPITGASVMQEVITVTGVTPDQQFLGMHPNAVREWCVNAGAIDPITRCAIVNSEDGTCYRWDFGSNTLSEAVPLNGPIGEAYTPTVIGVGGVCFAINNATLYAIGP